MIYSSPIQHGVQKGGVQKGAVIEGPADPAPADPPPVGDQASLTGDATLTVSVPEDARIFVNGASTTSTGSDRSYVSRGLQRGLNYTYEVRAEIEREGKTVEETKIVSLRAGQTSRLSFNLTASQAAPTTTVKLFVPEKAKVFLAGHETNSTGTVREFTTTRLAAGQSWDGYTIRVTLDQDGNTVSREKTITLRAGENQELSFDFDAPQVASVR